MKTLRYIIPLLWLVLGVPMLALADEGEQMKRYAEEYVQCEDAQSRLQLANRFFAFLRQIDYIDEPIAFPAGSHIDSVDVNVYYYVAEWYYGEGEHQTAIDYCTRATKCMGVVDDTSKSDVYALMGAIYFRMGAFDKAAKALNKCYELDKKMGDFDRMSSTLNGIASVFVAAGKPEEAEKYILEAIAANNLTENLSRRAVLYGTTSEIYRSIGDGEQSMEFAQKALDTERLLGDSSRIGARLSQLASAQLKLLKIDEASHSLEEAIPMLQRCGNLHSWGICKNQMGDILASKGENEEAAACYLEAAMLFLKQGDKYNEMHARKGLYEVTKSSSPNEAMMHLERAKQLQDTIFQQETSDAVGKYNAIYYNDILKKEKERIERRDYVILIAAVIVAAVLFTLIGIAIAFTYRRHKREVTNYEQNISSLQDQSAQLQRQYQTMIGNMVQLDSDNLTEDDREFLSQLTNAINESTERGNPDIESIASLMHVSSLTLRRRLSQTVSLTPKDYILKVRMNKAKYLLLNYRDTTIAEVADKCGYTQVSNFTRAFKNFYGIMPSEIKVPKDPKDLKDPKDKTYQ